MSEFFWKSAAVEPQLNTMLQTLAAAGFPLSPEQGARELTFQKSDKLNSLSVKRVPGGFELTYGSLAAAGRAIGSALSGIECSESTPFTMLGIMLDCSRNKVFTVEYIKSWLAKLALMGQNTVMLYTEDTYQLPDEPFWGYMRGPYTLAELQELDDYAAKLGIELIGCIQTLGHLAQALQWGEAYLGVRDTPNVLMVDEPKTYTLIEKMLEFWKSALRSRRIHIGMDETHDLGRGRFLDKHGYEKGFDLFNRHLTRVNELCVRHGYAAPTIWSDMYFRLSNSDLNYYDDSNPIPDEVKAKIPTNVQLCYWDYYHFDQEFYERYIKLHRDLGGEPMMGSGVWTWNRTWYDHLLTRKTIVPCIAACRKLEVKELIFTMWGDNGAYCQYGSSLAGLAYASDLAYGVSPEDSAPTAKRCKAICEMDYDLALNVSRIEAFLNIGEKNEILTGVYAFLWDDPLLAIEYRGALVRDANFVENRLMLLDEVIDAIKASGAAERCIEYRTILPMCELLRAKFAFRRDLEVAYAARDKAALRTLADSVGDMLTKLEEYDLAFRESWLGCAKPFGLEVIQWRNAGLGSRLREAQRRIGELLSGKVDRLDELEASLGAAKQYYFYGRVTGSTIRP